MSEQVGMLARVAALALAYAQRHREEPEACLLLELAGERAARPAPPEWSRPVEPTSDRGTPVVRARPAAPAYWWTERD